MPRVKGTHVHEMAIVGAGFGGLGMAIRLKQQGMDDFVVIERGDDVGGTWWANSYPGCQCDIPSNLYSFSFAPNPTGTAPTRCATRSSSTCATARSASGSSPTPGLNCELLAATWVADAQHWELETSAGPARRAGARGRAGAPQRAVEPALPGLERFQGNAFHTAQWDHSTT